MLEYLDKKIDTYKHFNNKGLDFNQVNEFNLPEQSIWPTMAVLMRYRNTLLIETMHLTDKIDRELEGLEKRLSMIETKKRYRLKRKNLVQIMHEKVKNGLSIEKAASKTALECDFNPNYTEPYIKEYKAYERLLERQKRDGRVRFIMMAINKQKFPER